MAGKAVLSDVLLYFIVIAFPGVLEALYLKACMYVDLLLAGASPMDEGGDFKHTAASMP